MNNGVLVLKMTILFHTNEFLSGINTLDSRNYACRLEFELKHSSVFYSISARIFHPEINIEFCVITNRI